MATKKPRQSRAKKPANSPEPRPNGWGGRRKGAGRKSKAELAIREQGTLDANAILVHETAGLIGNLLYLASGGFQQAEERWEPAGTVMGRLPVIDPVTKKPKLNKQGAPILAEQCLFPDLPPGQLVCVLRTLSVAAPDRQANIDLLNRILGRPIQAIEFKQGGTGPQLPDVLENAFARIFKQTEAKVIATELGPKLAREEAK